MEKNIEDRLFEFVYTMAFWDATMRDAFSRTKEEILNDQTNKADKKMADNIFNARKKQVNGNARYV